MRRGIVHAVVCGLLIAIGGVVVWSRGQPWGAPGPLGVLGIAPPVLGAAGLGIAAWACVALGRDRRVPPWLLLAWPLGCLLLAGAAEAIEIPTWLGHCAQQSPGIL